MSKFVPNSPTFTATVVSINRIDLTITLTNPGFEAGVEIYRTTGSGSINFQLIKTLAANVTSYSDTSVQPGCDYAYKVVALSSQPMFTPDKGTTRAASTPGHSPYGYINEWSNCYPVRVPVNDGTGGEFTRGPLA